MLLQKHIKDFWILLLGIIKCYFVVSEMKYRIIIIVAILYTRFFKTSCKQTLSVGAALQILFLLIGRYKHVLILYFYKTTSLTHFHNGIFENTCFFSN